VFPPETKTRRLDFDRLARLKIAGGNIQNVALNAAFLAARADTAVSMPLVLDAARAELRKLGRPLNESDFRWEEPSAGDPPKVTPTGFEGVEGGAEGVRDDSLGVIA
jgi:hypothetical protein